jgi:hypothetical protein
MISGWGKARGDAHSTDVKIWIKLRPERRVNAAFPVRGTERRIYSMSLQRRAKAICNSRSPSFISETTASFGAGFFKSSPGIFSRLVKSVKHGLK